MKINNCRNLLYSLKSLLIALFLLSSLTINAQKTDYTVYAVKAGETFASIAAKYNLNPHQLADYNNLDYYEGELLSKTLKIPLRTNKTVSAKQGSKAVKQVSKNDISTAEQTQPETSVVTANTEMEKSEENKPADKAQTSSTISSAPKPVETSGAVAKVNKDTDESRKVNSPKESKSLPPFRQMLPLIVFLSASILLLVAGIFFYKSATRRR